jgi:hypothetical protein
MGWACNSHEEMINSYRIAVEEVANRRILKWFLKKWGLRL